MKKTKRVLAILIALLLISLSTSALAEEVTLNLDDGDITIEMKVDGTYSVQQKTTRNHSSDTSFTVTQNDSNTVTGNTLTIKAAAGKTAKVTLSGVNIDVSTLPKAAVSTDGGGDVIIELKGKNTVKSGQVHAGVEKGNAGKLTIADDDNDGSLEAVGGNNGAGIGGGLMNGSGSDITITGGEVKATGGNDAAGIGGGLGGSGSNITISGGEVKATGGKDAAGIGGGLNGSGSGINITGGEVKAAGGGSGAGIGGGLRGSGSGINITGGEVTATGGDQGAGIGGGYYGHGNNIAISGGEVKATGGQLGAGIGGGAEGSGSDITISGGTVKATSDHAGAGIGGGWSGKSGKVTFSGKVLATVQGGVGDRNYGAGAGIGDGGSFSNGNPVDGDDLHRTNSNLLNVSDLEPGAIIRCYKQGTGIPDSLLYEIPELPTPEPSETPEPPTPGPSENPNPSTPPTPGGGNGGGHSHYYPTTTPVPVIVIPPKTGDMTIWQSILHFLGIR